MEIKLLAFNKIKGYDSIRDVGEKLTFLFKTDKEQRCHGKRE